MSKQNSVIRENPVTHCIFCGAPNPTSEEHIIPAWIFRAFEYHEIPYAKVTDINHILPNGELNAAAQVISNDATSPILCQSCNADFSGQIQIRASETLKSFFIGNWRKLTKEEINVFVRWYTCYLMVREMQHDNHETFTQSEREDFRFKGFIPQSLNIWIAPLRSIGHMTNHRKLLELDQITQNHKPVHIAVMAVGFLLIISFGADPNGVFGKNTQEFLQIKKLLSDLRFVQIRDFNRKKAIHFPNTLPGYFMFPGVIEMTDLLTIWLESPELPDPAPYIDYLPGRFDLLFY